MIYDIIKNELCGNRIDSKTRDRLKENTVLLNYPFYCLKSRHETLIKAENMQITVLMYWT